MVVVRVRVMGFVLELESWGYGVWARVRELDLGLVLWSWLELGLWDLS